MFIAALLIIDKRWKQSKCLLTDKWITKMEHYWVTERNEALMYAITWINLKNILLSERTVHKRSNMVCLHLYEVSGIDKLMKIEYRFMVAKGQPEDIAKGMASEC